MSDHGIKATVVSVLIPNYNQTHYVVEAIESVLRQSYCDYEIIVIDDGSTDNCAEALAPYSGRIRYVRQENRGLAGARNTGLRVAQGVLIGLLDADDRWAPDFLSTMVNLADSHPDAAVCYCAARSIDPNGDPLSQIFGVRPATPDPLYEILLRANFIIPSTVLLRKEPVLDAGCFDETLRSCEDWDLWLRLLPKHSFIGCGEPLVEYRVHSASLTQDPAGMRQALRSVVEKHFGPEEGHPAAWTREKRRAFGGMYRYFLLSAMRKPADSTEPSRCLRRCLELDPALASDLDFFYDLALGDRPNGHRDKSDRESVDRHAGHALAQLARAFPDGSNRAIAHLRRRSFATACHAIGLLSYNSGLPLTGASYLLKAAFYGPALCLRPAFLITLMKAFVPMAVLRRARQWRRKFTFGSSRFATGSVSVG
jgi:glycosyltransferase involved in cell wall biosynthesis